MGMILFSRQKLLTFDVSSECGQRFEANTFEGNHDFICLCITQYAPAFHCLSIKIVNYFDNFLL